MENNVIIRQFEERDTQEVQHLIDSVLHEFGFSFNPHSAIDSDLLHIKEIYQGRGNFWVAVIDKEIVGTVALREESEKKAKLKRMFVNERYRGKQIGLQLLLTAVSFAKRQGFTSIVLNTSPKMKRAHLFYEKFGFRKVGEDSERLHYELTFPNDLALS